MVTKGDILYALYGATSGEVSISTITGAINQAVLAIKPLPNYDNYFIVSMLQLIKINITSKYLQGGQGNLSGKIIRMLKISFPNYDEQIKVGLLIKQLDSTITLHQRKIEQYQELKKTLLSKMFI